MKGEINANANIRIDGNFEGAIHVEGNVMIGEGARVNASIQAHNISVFGSVHGNLSGHKVTIGRTGRVWGDLNAATFSTEEGAYLDGRISMTHHPAARGEQPALASANEAPTILTEEANDLIEAEVVDDER
jgi:cytoskeletal protein CcmA (bactofilin family)